MDGSRPVVRNTLLQAGGEVLTKLASLAFYVVMARELGADGFGQYMFALALVVMLTTLAGFGTDELLTRQVARDRESLHRLFWNSITVKTGLGLVLVGVALLVSVLGGNPPEVNVVVVLLAVGALLELLAKTVGATFLAYEDLRPVASGLVVQRFSTAAGGITALLAGAGIVLVSVIFVCGAALGLVYVSVSLYRREIRPRREVSLKRAREVAIQAAPLGLVILLTTIVFRIDATLLSFLKDSEAVGHYSAAYRALESVLFLPYAIETALFPVFARLARPALGAAYEGGLKAIVAFTAPLGVTFLLFGGPILDLLYGDEYRAAEPALQWLGGAAVLYGVTYLSASVLIAQNRQRELAWAVAGIMAFNIALNLVLIPRWSMTGAAAATTITEGVQALVLGLLAHRSTGRVSGRRILTGPAVAAVAMVGVVLATGDGLAGFLGGGVAYLLVLLAAERALFPADVEAFLGGLRDRLGLARRVRPPLILAYHGVADVPAHRDPEGLLISPRRFRRHVRRLKRWGYGFLSFGDMARAVAEGRGEGHVALTFDDGLLDNLETLVPILRGEGGLPATVFVTTGWMGSPHPTVPYLRNMTADEVRALHEAGVEIGGHTVTHPDLTTLSFEEARDEVREGCRQLAEIIGAPVDTFAYPFGHTDEQATRAVAAAGVRAACRVRGEGSWDDPLNLPRQDNNTQSWLGFWLKRDDRYERIMRHRPARLVRRAGKERRWMLSRMRTRR